MTASRPAIFAALLSALLSSACTEDPLVVVDRESAPGASTPTIEMVFDAALLPSWRKHSVAFLNKPLSGMLKVVRRS